MGELEEFYAEENAVIMMGVTAGIGSSLVSAEVAYEDATQYFDTPEFVANVDLPAGNSGIPFSLFIDLETMEVMGRDNSTSDFLDKFEIYNLAKDANE